MKTKTGYNDFDYCSAIKGSDLLGRGSVACENNSHSRQYTLNSTKKKTIREGFKAQGIDINNINWIGEKRTQLKNGDRLQYGYSAFVNED